MAMAMPIEPFTFQQPEKWPLWLRRFERCCRMDGYSKRPQFDQLDRMVMAMGPEAEALLASFPEEAWMNYGLAVENFTRHFGSAVDVGKSNINATVLNQFHSRVQDPNESTQSFLQEVARLADACGFPEAEKSDQILQRVLAGLCNVELKSRLLAEGANLNYNRAGDVLLRLGLHLPNTTASSVRGNKIRPLSNECSYCGEVRQGGGGDPRPPHWRPQCPASKSICEKCQNQGHFTNMCRSPANNAKDGGRQRGTPQNQCSYCGSAPHPRSQCPASNATCNACHGMGHLTAMCRTLQSVFVVGATPRNAQGDGVDGAGRRADGAVVATASGCEACGGPVHKQPTACLAAQVTCLVCNTRGHYARMCKTVQRSVDQNIADANVQRLLDADNHGNNGQNPLNVVNQNRTDIQRLLDTNNYGNTTLLDADDDDDRLSTTSRQSSGQRRQPRQPRRNKKQADRAAAKPMPELGGNMCFFCGGDRHPNREDCPALLAVCSFCNKPGHLDNVCFAKNATDTEKKQNNIPQQHFVRIAAVLHEKREDMGLAVRMVNQGLHPGPSSLFVFFVTSQSEAFKQGLRRGDFVVAINNQDARKWSAAQAENMLRLQSPTTITCVRVQRNQPRNNQANVAQPAQAAAARRRQVRDATRENTEQGNDATEPVAANATPATQGADQTDGYMSIIKEMFDRLPIDCRQEAVGDILDVIERYLPGKENNGNNVDREEKNEANKLDMYLELMRLNQTPVIFNSEEFECAMCLSEQTVGSGVVLKDCLHTFCTECLVRLIETSDDVEIKCPYRSENIGCDYILSQAEIKSIVPDNVLEKYMQRSLSIAEHLSPDSYHCKTPDCRGWCIIEDDENPEEPQTEFLCPVCHKVNCLLCQAIHPGMDCERFKQMGTVDSAATLDVIGTLLDSREGMPCPKCKVVVIKQGGCDAVECPMCKTMICWVTRGPRWGPAGRGDISGGCRCGVNGQQCHPSCQYCH